MIHPFEKSFSAPLTAANKIWMSGVVLLLSLGAVCVQGQTTSGSMTTVLTNYHGWSNSVSLNNGVVEAVIVPTVGRVQQFRFAGDTNGVLWENQRTWGRTPTGSGFYPNFGGDKVWPSPQSEWGWPPLKGFDGSVCTASFTNGIVTLVTPVDTTYNIRTTRIIELLANQPVMRVRTIFERTAESSKTNLGIWIDCQATVTPDSRCYVPVPSPSIFPNGYTTTGSAQFTAALPAGFTNANGLISFQSDSANHKVGFDGGTLALVGPSLSLRVDAPRIPGATYPDGNSSTEVYTAGPNYFELEMLGPLAALPVGGKMEFTTTYSLFHRTEATTDAEAHKVLAWKH
jgi:hypothetical protein